MTSVLTVPADPSTAPGSAPGAVPSAAPVPAVTGRQFWAAVAAELLATLRAWPR